MLRLGRLILVAALGAAAVPGSWALAAAQDMSVDFALGSSGIIYMPIDIAAKKGYFKDEGLNAELKVLRGGVQALAAVVAGDADVYVGPPSTAMRAIQKGQDLKVFAAVMNQIPSDFVIQGDAAKEHGITPDMPLVERIKRIKGMTFGVNAPGSAPDQTLRFVAAEYGLDPDKDLTISAVGAGSALLAAFQQKRIDGFVWSSPTSATAIKKFGGQLLLRFSTGEFEALNGFLYLSLIARSEWLAENPKRAVATARAIGRAMQLIREHPDEARSLVRDEFPDMADDMFNDAFAANAASIPTSLKVTVADIELAKKFEEKTSDVRFDMAPETVFTSEYVKDSAD